MSKKVFNVFSILCFALVLCFIGCTELINPKTETDINLNIDLSKIIKSTRNTGETQSSASLDENPTIKVAIYDAKKYNATTNSTDNLDLITEAQAKIVNNEAKVKLNILELRLDSPSETAPLFEKFVRDLQIAEYRIIKTQDSDLFIGQDYLDV